MEFIMYAYARLLKPSRPRRNSHGHGPCMQWPRSIQAIQAKANIPMLTRLLFFPSLHVSFLFPKHHISLPSSLARHKGRAGKGQRGPKSRTERDVKKAKCFSVDFGKESCVPWERLCLCVCVEREGWPAGSSLASTSPLGVCMHTAHCDGKLEMDARGKERRIS
jgi:hypothetical protein